MKTLHLLLIGILFVVFGCSEDVITMENTEVLKAAKIKSERPKTVTIPAHGKVTTFPDLTAPLLACTPDLGIQVASTGTCTGYSTMTGTFVQEESTFNTYLCNIEFTLVGTPVIYAESNVTITGNNGDMKFLKSYIRIDVVTNVVTGTNELIDGTGRFEGISGVIDIVDGRFDPETGSTSWKEEGYMEVVVRD